MARCSMTIWLNKYYVMQLPSLVWEFVIIPVHKHLIFIHVPKLDIVTQCGLGWLILNWINLSDIVHKALKSQNRTVHRDLI